MEVLLSSDRARYVRRLVGDGRFDTPESAVEAALRLLEEKGLPSPLRRAVAIGLEQVLAGRASPVTADDVVRRAVRR